MKGYYPITLKTLGKMGGGNITYSFAFQDKLTYMISSVFVIYVVKNEVKLEKKNRVWKI